MICPNCNTPAEGNYCANCGQKTHLHKETFWHLVGHFMGHYFHWESKFWHTFKVLITKPGALTLAYHNKQRMRFVPPINLYIFASIFFFILVSYTVKVGFVTHVDRIGKKNIPTYYLLPSFGSYNFAKIKTLKKDYKAFSLWDYDSVSIRGFVQDVDNAEQYTPPLYKMLQIKFKWDYTYIYYNYFTFFLLGPYLHKHEIYTDLDAPFAAFCTDYFHVLSKLFFVLMPFLGWLIHLAFRKKGFLYVDHAILSLHTHLLLFVSMAFHFLLGCLIDLSHAWCLGLSIILIPGLYFILALRKVYGFSKLRTVILGSIIWCFYVAFAFSFTLFVNVILFRYA